MARRDKQPGGTPVLPMQLEIGDRFTDSDGEWEIASIPCHSHGGKTVHVTVQRPGAPGTRREKTWAAHEHVTITRA
jgi:hypothetical protein